MKRCEIKRLDEALPRWRSHLPRTVWPVVVSTAGRASPELAADFLDKFHRAGRQWGFLPASPFAGRVLMAMIRRLEGRELRLYGRRNFEEAFQALRAGRIRHLSLVCNHVSYSDANLVRTALDGLLRRYGLDGDFTVVVGPKVFSHPARTFAALNFNTVMVAQSLARATPEAAFPLAEIVKAARQAMSDIDRRVRLLHVFPEGGRSRSGALMQFLPGAWRLLDVPRAWGVVPVAVVGSEHFLGVGQSRLRRASISIRGGPMLLSQDLRPLGRAAMDRIGKAVADLLPPSRRGYYA